MGRSPQQVGEPGEFGGRLTTEQHYLVQDLADVDPPIHVGGVADGGDTDGGAASGDIEHAEHLTGRNENLDGEGHGRLGAHGNAQQRVPVVHDRPLAVGGDN